MAPLCGKQVRRARLTSRRGRLGGHAGRGCHWSQDGGLSCVEEREANMLSFFLSDPPSSIPPLFVSFALLIHSSSFSKCRSFPAFCLAVLVFSRFYVPPYRVYFLRPLLLRYVLTSRRLGRSITRCLIVVVIPHIHHRLRCIVSFNSYLSHNLPIHYLVIAVTTTPHSHNTHSVPYIETIY